jgi:hypothetical protein
VGRVPRAGGRRRHPVGPGVGEDQPAAQPAVRVQRRLLGLRRDAVPQAAHPAVRRPPADRQRHRAAPASTAATCRPPRTPRAPTAGARRGPTACSRTTPSSVSASASASRRNGVPHSRRSVASATGSIPRSPRRSSTAIDDVGDAGIRAQRERVDQLLAALAGIDGRPTLYVWWSSPGRWSQERVDRRRRRLGVRHRCRRPRPRARQRPQREHPGDGHRGVLEHRRPGVEGHAARRRREVRGERQGHREEGPRPRGDDLRRRVRRQDRARRERRADREGPARSGRLAGRVAGDRLQQLHGPRLRHVASR